MYILDVGAKQSVAERNIWNSERTLLPEVANIFNGDARVQWPNVGGKKAIGKLAC